MTRKAAPMFPVTSYEQVEQNEIRLGEKHIVVLLFVRPSLPGADKIIEEFSYLHQNSRKYCSIYAVGFSNSADFNAFDDFRAAGKFNRSDLHFSDRAFVAFKDKLETRLNWRYSGDIELIILQSNPGSRNILNFENYLAIDVNYGIKNDYIESFPRFMESLVREARKEVETAELADGLRKARFRIKDIVCTSLDESKKIPKPVKRIIRDRLFYRTSTSYVKK